MPGPTVLTLDVTGPVFEWRGPSPFYFVTVPEEESDVIHALAGDLSYGWGCITVDARLGDTSWSTALIPREGLYVVPLKAAIRKAEGLGLDDVVTIELTFRGP